MGIEFRAIYRIWLRDILGQMREKERFISFMIMPFLWFIIFGSGLASDIQLKGLNMDFSSYLAPGVLSIPILSTSMFLAVSIIIDRKSGFLKELLVAPISRFSIVLGKALSNATIATAQGLVIMFFFILLGINMSYSLIIAIPLMFLLSLGFASLGIIVACLLKTVDAFYFLMNLINMIFMFLSGAFIPASILPGWMQLFYQINPMTYGVEALRHAFTGTSTFVPFMIWST